MLAAAVAAAAAALSFSQFRVAISRQSTTTTTVAANFPKSRYTVEWSAAAVAASHETHRSEGDLGR